MPNFYGDFETFLHDEGDKVFMLRRLRRVYTPAEVKAAYIDEEEYVTVFDYCKIAEVIALPTANNYLIGFQGMYIDTKVREDKVFHSTLILEPVEYFLLSEIQLSDVTEKWKEYCEYENVEE